MLLVAIVKRIGSSRPIGGTASSLTSVPADYPKENESSAVLNRLTAWCAWLLESEALEAPFVSVSQDAMKSKILGISRKLSVKADLSDELCRELLRSCLRLSVEKGPLDELVSLIALKAGNKKLQQKALMLAKFGSISSRPGSSQKSDGNMNQESVLGSAARLIKKTAQGPAAGALEASVSPEKSTRTSEAAYEDDSSYEKVKTLQQDLLARMASKGMDSNKSAPLDAPRAASEGAASVRGYRDAGPQGRKWTLSQKWRPCAIGMIPSPYSVVGILPSLDLPQTAAAKHMSERQARVEGLGMQPHTSVDTVEDRNKDRVTGGEETSFSERNAGKRKGEVESSSLSGEKRVKVGNRVRFNLENGGNGKPSDPLSSRQSSVRKEIQGARSEVPSGGSLLQGCLRQHGQFMFVSSEQLESLKAAVHVL
ncbi:hypothetical protein R1flu_015192 [Riccia fluitans]|uniref:Uncharacterized protein n=1 Tax=Riccia fluitans TaxID=41844 RepID=A0ABD1YI84_9MARC